MQIVRRPVQMGVVRLAMLSARNPCTTIVVGCLLSVVLVVIGFFTNFTFESDQGVLFTPSNAISLVHQKWINEESDFPKMPRNQKVLLHSKGENILKDCRGCVSKAFDVLEGLEGLDGYDALCQTEKYNCPWSGITQFFNNSRDVYEDANLQSNEDCLAALSVPSFPSGELAPTTLVFGHPIYNETTSILTSAESILCIMGFPPDEDIKDDVKELEAEAIDALFEVADKWEREGASLFTILEQYNESVFAIEFERGFLENVPFWITALTLMSVFTAVVFFKKDPVQSRMAVGLGASATVIVAMVAGFGLSFICGVPMTSITGILIFVLVGIGLDDSFIIVADFYRHPRSLPIEERVHKTMHNVGLSIFTTSMTSTCAFGLGCISSIRAVYWVCLYAFPTISIIFLYSVTMFVAIIVIDERRVDANRRDFLCFISKETKATEADYEITRDVGTDGMAEQPDSYVDRFMAVYADFLLQPVVKVLVLVIFAAIFAACAWSTTLLKQDFNVELVLPQGSYAVTFLRSIEKYTSWGRFETSLVFREIDQSTAESQQAMEKYLNDMVALKEVTSQPGNFWLRDFQSFSQNNSALDGLTFDEQMSVFLDLPVYSSLYASNIARNEQGQVTASRVSVWLDQVDIDDVKAQIVAFDNQERVARMQAVNNGLEGNDWAFFSFDASYFVWSFFKVCPQGLKLTTITGLTAVTLISVFAIPHWSSGFFSAPLTVVLYVDLLGFLQFWGVTINAVSYITLTLSIGLMVDFLIHILLQYYESTEATRDAKVKDTLKTLGASVGMGGLTTFLGVLPLVFNTTGIFEVLFVSFLGLVLLGVSHGLILLPVLLSICGPEDNAVVLLTNDDGGADVNTEKREVNGGTASAHGDHVVMFLTRDCCENATNISDNDTGGTVDSGKPLVRRDAVSEDGSVVTA